ncbi:MAG: hypothetical protein KF824_00195 [Fimbriimonadaceae bacterium]|nr:MAG: hypothetical protein KF824_00195 [Fimbriimonadaceae bacterium]
MKEISSSHPLSMLLIDLINQEVERHIGSTVAPSTKSYLGTLLLDFMRTDRLYQIRSADGKPVQSIIEMLAEGDVRTKADSFDREREVHKHIGDFILFWTGIYPEHFKKASLSDLTLHYIQQGKQSYHLVSTFSHKPYDAEAPIFDQLSQGFEDFAFILNQVGYKSGLQVA